jgi:hypothetical protein
MKALPVLLSAVVILFTILVAMVEWTVWQARSRRR